MNLRSYSQAKSTGKPWIGQIPAHWDLVPLRYVTQCLDGQRVPLNSEQRADRPGEVPYWGANAIMGYVDNALFDEELILLGEDGAPFFDRTRQVAFRSSGRVWPNNHIHVLRPIHPVSADFVTYALNATDFAEFIDGSTRDKLTQGQMSAIPLPWPPLPEQTAIAAFLDRETGKIDALVEEQRRLIELLKEKRQAVISHAVTKGLDPHAKTKPSGADWLGNVPEHWNVEKAKRLFIERDERSPSGEETLLTVSHLTGVTPRAEKNVTMTEAETTEGYKLSLPGDLVINTLWAWMGAMGVTSHLGIVSPAYNVYTPNERLLPSYVNILVQMPAFAREVERYSKGVWSSRLRLYPAEFFQVLLPVPSRDEQGAIVDHVEKQTSSYASLVAEAEGAIGLLAERRAALISAAVTGKIDVRVLGEATTTAA